MITANRYHDICCGHRVYGHESKCAHLHGHNYRFHFFVAPNEQLDKIGRVLDFSVIKTRLCDWLEANYDHRFLLWKEDPLAAVLKRLDPAGVVIVPYNPTAENIAKYFVETIAPELMQGTNATLIKLTIEETRKCSVTYEKESFEKIATTNLDVRTSEIGNDIRNAEAVRNAEAEYRDISRAISSIGRNVGSYEEKAFLPGSFGNWYGGIESRLRKFEKWYNEQKPTTD